MTKGIGKSYENGVFRLVFPSKINKDNAAEITKYVFDGFPNDVTNVEVDAQNLIYISSDGLDILLELKKRCRDISLIHVSAGLYEVLTSYGFTNFISVEKKYRSVSVKGLKVLGEGAHGKVYKLNEDMIIKVFIDKSDVAKIEKERIFAKNAFVNGIPSPIAFDVVSTEEGYGLILELAGAETLGNYLFEHPEETEELGNKFADLLIQLNNTYADPQLYPSIKDVYRERANNSLGKFTQKEVNEMLEVIDSLPDGEMMIHGDYHTNNVMIDKNKNLMLIDMADISYGNGFFDIAGSYLVFVFCCKFIPSNMKKICGLNYKQCPQIWNILLRKYYNIKTDQEYERYMKLCAVFSDLRICTTMGIKGSEKNVIKRKLSLCLGKIILRKYKKWIELFKSI